ncbi:DUF4383 domain-containing protein [Brachybacterium fresconis]|uniref:Lipopolysaccharide export LptBFGC system permease protein LptF n=1 Tax=Brachybacterium fresconis TaxID=173363 RepID=A0ABS4YI00_9MICO|nr:DUF4383 domain-containing protein [Brachybacterium fresconis]MBP2407518.1 lipopolysaccharide export LptBFGC system permease protein LptF [Brachybacterium fresconis]
MNATVPSGPAHGRGTKDIGRSPVRLAALLCGFVFLVVGVAGFVPGVTTNFDSIGIAARSEAMLLGIFQVSALHNVIHLLYGFAGLTLSRLSGTARLYLLVGGIIYAVLWIYGIVIDKDSTANFVPLNTADDWLHFVLALTMIGLSVLPRHAAPTAAEADRRP